MRIFVGMKAKLNLSIEQNLLLQMKEYAARQKKSISEIVEEYFRAVSRHKKEESFVEMIDKLPKVSIAPDLDLKEEYYKAKAKKYGF
jgi:Family of unknown function (DUF6364)